METKVGIREFREKLPSYLDSLSPVAITRHGETIGYYIPTRRGRTQAQLDALKDAVAKLEAVMLAGGISEEDIIDEFKVRRVIHKP